MGNKIDLTGKVFGRLTVLYEIPERRNKKIYWHCKCQCGNECDINGQYLRTGATQSCGCYHKEKVALMGKMGSKDLTGQRYERLTAIRPINKKSGTNVVWECRCDCGKTTYVSTGQWGHTKSCGCLGLEQISELGKQSKSQIIGQHFGKLTIIEDTGKRSPSGSVIWKCLCECGNYCEHDTSTLKSGNAKSCGCIKSIGEATISKILQENNIPFIKEYTIKDTHYRFDFYVDNKYFIEYDGEQHFHSRGGWSSEENVKLIQERDTIKNQWCKDNNISLIRIPYTHLNDLNIKDLQLETSGYIVI